jgi:hypothetical protein
MSGDRVIKPIFPPKKRFGYGDSFVRGILETQSPDSADKFRLPSLSIQRIFGGRENEQLANESHRLVIREYSEEKNRILVADLPRWIDLSYQLDFFAKTFEDGNEFWEYLMRKHRNGVIHKGVKFEYLRDKFNVSIMLEDVSDNSELEGEEVERLIRITATLTAVTPLQTLPEWIATVRKITAQLYHIPSNKLLETQILVEV